jgi:hypothetical protein
MNVYRPVLAESSVEVVPARGWCERLPLITMTGRVLVRRIVRVSLSSSTASVGSETWTRRMRPAWTQPSATRWRQTVITPAALTRR